MGNNSYFKLSYINPLLINCLCFVLGRGAHPVLVLYLTVKYE